MSDRPSDDQRNAATFSALALVLLVSIGLLGFMALVLPQVLWMLLIAGGMGLFIVLHYLIWGRWLLNKLRDEAEPRVDTPNLGESNLNPSRDDSR